MCFGTELAAAALAKLSMGAKIAGTVVSTAGTVMQGMQQSAMYNYQAKVANYNADLQKMQAEQAAKSAMEEESKLRRRGRAFVGRQKAIMGASGLSVDASLLTSTQNEIELDALTIRNNAQKKIWGHRTQELNFRNSASAYKAGAKNAKMSGIIGGMSTALGGIGVVADRWYQYKQFGG